MSTVKIINGRILTPYRIIEGGTLAFQNGKIIYVGESDIDLEYSGIIDAKGSYVSPGFIDMHSHGGGGHDFMDGTVEAYLGAAEMHARHGTTSILPTTLTSTNEELRNTFRVFKEAKKQNQKGAALLGLHLEGPYFAMSQRGAQDPRYIRNPNKKEYEEILGWSEDIVRWSAAPELEGAVEFGRVLKSRGVLPSVAHSDATYEEVLEAFENGFTHVTHMYSAMSGVHRKNAYRFAGVIESAYLIEDMTVEMIADGHHLPPCLLQLIYKIKGPSKTALVTDSLRGAGMGEGESIVGSLADGQKIIIEGGVAKLLDRSAFAGSVATTNRLVSTVVNQAGIPLLDAVQMMTSTPARIIGADDQKGSLAAGKDADIVIFDNHIDIKMTIVNGSIVYQQKG
ncbi:MAG: N-acetylglucosamine-6-phosphate deacetylase [Caldicoprobacterales bacterium]|jgi:N-acetylglucosamine-6-phosphate deacetylase|nr:N-acetylglucosamine-6-phosphate deacetylase [Clostridiales bacterium]